MKALKDDPRYVARIMRRILKDQVTTRDMDRDTVRMIFDTGLLVKREWPAFVIMCTARGNDYLAAAGGDNGSDQV